MSRYYPVFLDLEGRTCLLVGGGSVAGRKAKSLLECGAKVRMVSPKVFGWTEEMVKSGNVEHIPGAFEPKYLEGAALVIAATDDAAVNRSVYEESKKRNIPVNVVDQPELCTFIVPSLVKRGDLLIATSTSGKSPAVAKRVRMALEKEFGEEWAVYLEMMGKARAALLEKVPDQAGREALFNKLADSDLLEKIKSGDIAGAEKLVEEIIP
ncbi:MAG: bifunctional precorrin-2 dehydrogenase/sirohydrochlorin ferrochelatase [Nitrospinae bacterium]|nr:bifunctional precorrin-2 dehydrogenase/sirohydrochlorin ferrochelatase [Nitrospinota bacterium]